MTRCIIPASGGSTGTEAPSQTEAAIRAAHAILAALDLHMSPRRVNRLVRQFEARVAANGWNFLEFFGNACALTKEQIRQAAADPDVARVIAHADPTGEIAVNHVVRQRGF